MRRLPQRIFAFYWGQGIADDVPALTYYLVLSLAPFALGVAALEALLLNDTSAAFRVAEQINRFLPEAVHTDVRRLVVGTREHSPLLIVLAVTSMLWTSSGAIGVIERVESRILDCPRHNVAMGRVRNIALGALVAFAVVAAAGGSPAVGTISAVLKLRGGVPGTLLLVVNVVGSIAVFAVIYRFAPRSHLRWRSAFGGAVPTALALQVVPVLVGLYFGATAGFAAARVFLLLAVLLFGLYVMALVMLVGAGLAVRRELGTRAGDRPVAGAPKAMFAAEGGLGARRRLRRLSDLERERAAQREAVGVPD